MKHTIELATVDNTDTILALYAPYIQNTAITFEYDIPTKEDFMERIKKVNHYFPWLIYKIGDTIVGYAYASFYKERAAFQWDVEVSVYIDPAYQGLGIGSSLYHTLFDFLTLQGFYNIYALICVPNESSIRLHQRFGFEMMGVCKRAGYKLDRWHDLATLVKPLQSFDKKPAPTISFQELDSEELSLILKKYVTKKN